MPALTVLTVIDWLSSLASAAPLPPIPYPPFLEGPYIREMPDRVIHVTLQPGLGYAFEAAIDQPTFQVRCRSDQNNQPSGEFLAQDLDYRIRNARYPTEMNFTNDNVSLNTAVQLVTRAAGAPAPLGPPDDGMRFEYVCTYRCIVGV